MAYVGTTFAEITTSAAMQTVAVCVSPDYAAYLLVRDAGGTLSAADGSWTISDQSLEFTFDDVNVVYVTTGETFTVNGTQYEVQNITVSGMDEDQFAERTYTYYDSSDYKGKNGVQYINMNFPGAFRRFTMPYSDVTVTVAWGPVSGTTDEIAAARESAAETIRSVYASYQQPDYSEANWTALTAVKDAALTALETAASLDDVRTIRKNALADMASIEKLSGSVAGLPDFGRVVGQVHISIENTTFPDCPYEGVLQAGDEIRRVNGHRIYFTANFSEYAAADADGDLNLVIRRDGKKIRLNGYHMVPVEYKNEDGSVSMKYGLYFGIEKANVFSTLKYSFYTCLDFVRMVWKGLVMLFSGQAAMSDMTGVVGIVDIINETGQSAPTVSQGLENIIYLVAFIAVNLSVMNMLPIPALDGGHVLTLLVSWLIEKISGKKPDPRIEGYIHYVGLILLLGLMAVVLYNDIARIIAR